MKADLDRQLAQFGYEIYIIKGILPITEIQYQLPSFIKKDNFVLAKKDEDIIYVKYNDSYEVLEIYPNIDSHPDCHKDGKPYQSLYVRTNKITHTYYLKERTPIIDIIYRQNEFGNQDRTYYKIWNDKFNLLPTKEILITNQEIDHLKELGPDYAIFYKNIDDIRPMKVLLGWSAFNSKKPLLQI